MAKKRRPSPLDEPPSPTASSEDEQQPSSQPQEDEEEEEEEEEAEQQQQQEASSGDDEDSSDEEDQPPSLSQTASKNPPPPSTNSHPKPSSSSESESGSDSESEPDDAKPPPPPNPKVKPLASKPMDQNPKTKVQAQAQSSPAPTRSGTKRAVENNNTHVNDSKRAKKKATAAAGGSDDEMEAEDDAKKSGDDSRKTFQRVWSEEDEITILKGLADFISKSGNDPVKFINVFYDCVKKSLHFDASSSQLKQKVRRLRDKYKANAEKAKNGEDPTFPKPHEQKLFELSKKVWGNGPNEAEEKGKPNGKPAKSPKREASRRTTASAKKQPPAKKPVAETREEPDSPAVVAVKESGEVETDKVVGDSSLILSEMFRFDKGVGLNGLNEDVVKRGVELIGESKKAELEGRWKKLQVAELELFVKRAQLIEDQARLILEAYKSSNH